MRKKLKEVGIKDFQWVKPSQKYEEVLKKKVDALRERGMSYEKIADHFNLWGMKTKSKKGKWFPKTIREITFGREFK